MQSPISSEPKTEMPGVLQRKPWVVQKYGGTSLGKLLETITITIIPQYLECNNVAIVCSAISGTSRSVGTTSLLLQAMQDAMDGSTSKLDVTIGTIRDVHIKASKAIRISVNTKAQSLICDELAADIVQECDQLRLFLEAAQIGKTIGEVSERSKDRILNTGERLACRLVVASLMVKGIEAELVSLADIVATTYGDDVVAQQRAYDDLGPGFFTKLATGIGLKLEACGTKVPVVTGFFGVMPNSVLPSVGRGYSDLCAVMCARGVSASQLQIWKEVDGIFTADPRKVPSAKLLPTITLEEASELMYYGSEVTPLIMQQMRLANFPLHLKNVKNPGGKGTIIYPSASISGKSSPLGVSGTELGEVATASCMNTNGSCSGNDSQRQHRPSPTAITTKDNIVLLNIQSSSQTRSHGFLAQVFNTLDQMNVIANLVTTSEKSISIAISLDRYLGEGEGDMLQRLVVLLGKFGNVDVKRELTIVSVVGHRMRNMVGIAGEIFSKLAKGGVNIYLIGQGASEINISCVVKDEDALLAMGIIHLNVLGIPNAKHIPSVRNSPKKDSRLY